MEADYRKQMAKKVTLLGAFVNFLLGVIKLVAGTWGHSHAMVADGIHSFSDLISDVMVFFAAHYGGKRVDSDHQYGHQRIETAATLFLSLMLVVVGAGIAYDSVHNFILQEIIKPNKQILIVALISILANEFLYFYTLAKGKEIKSDLLIANAWHHRSDSASSFVVLVGLIGAILGYSYFDLIASLIVGLMIVKMGWFLAWRSIRELIDTAVDEQTLEEIHQIICNVSGVVSIHQLRTRLMGGEIFIDVHVQVAPDISVSEGHHIAQNVHFDILKNIESSQDVTVHIDPEDDEISAPSLHLPAREIVQPLFIDSYKKIENLQLPNKTILHYSDGKMEVELFFKLSQLGDATFDDYQQSFKDALKDVGFIREIRLYWS